MKSLILLFSLCMFSSAVCGQDEKCYPLPRLMKHRLQKEGAGWLADKRLQKRIAKRSQVFGILVQLQQCRWPETLAVNEWHDSMLYMVVDGLPFQAMYRRYRDTWVMAVKPHHGQGEMPEANVLEITGQKWTLIHRDTDGSMRVVAAYYY